MSYKHVGVYGDSFAVEVVKDSWVDKLRTKLNCDVTSYGLSGSSLVYSYSKFMKNYATHDLNIFVLTDPTREDLFDIKENEIVYKIISDDKHDQIISKGIQAKRALYPKSYHYINMAIFDSVLLRDKNIVIINAMNYDYGPNTMLNIQHLDHDFFFKKMRPELENPSRPCHMSKKQNEEFASYLVKHLNNEIDIHETFKSTNVKKCYTRSNSLYEAGLNKNN
jgi:hypothetical protein